jgi:hypothetical protein
LLECVEINGHEACLSYLGCLKLVVELVERDPA